MEHEQPAGRRIFVFGSNLAGRHGKGAALYAKRWLGAVQGVGTGPTGDAYALPTKDARLVPLPLPVIAEHIAGLLTYARRHPAQTFEISRVGCGLAGYADADVAPLFFAAPPNCVLPYVWERMRNPRAIPRVIVAGSRNFTAAATAEHEVGRLTQHLGYFEIVSGGARGADALGEAYGARHGYPVEVMPADWNRYGKAAGMIRNQRMSWSASHLIAFWIAQSRGTANMIETARRDGLAVRIWRPAVDNPTR